jgi:hypothetical protein
MDQPKILHNGELVHTTNSTGNQIHATEEGIHKFHDWFGDSKSVDEHGRPKVMYHGSVTKGIEDFDPNVTPVRPRSGPNGTYFTSELANASGYTRHPRKFGEKPNPASGGVTHAYLSLKSPLDITGDIKKHQKTGMSFGDAKKKALEKLDTSKHDSVIFKGNSVNSDEYIALHPNQIKSVKNVGEFSKNSNKINESQTFLEYLVEVRGARLNGT